MVERLLIVDDESSLRFALTDFFGASGFCVDAVGSFTEAVVALDAADYDAVLLDLGREPRGVMERLALVHRARQTKPTRAIVVLGIDGPSAATEAMRRGADAYFNKPVGLPQLAQALHDGCQARRQFG